MAQYHIISRFVAGKFRSRPCHSLQHGKWSLPKNRPPANSRHMMAGTPHICRQFPMYLDAFDDFVAGRSGSGSISSRQSEAPQLLASNERGAARSLPAIPCRPSQQHGIARHRAASPGLPHTTLLPASHHDAWRFFGWIGHVLPDTGGSSCARRERLPAGRGHTTHNTRH